MAAGIVPWATRHTLTCLPAPPAIACWLPPCRPGLQLSERCAEQVFKEEVEEAKNFAIDPELREACGKDAGGGGACAMFAEVRHNWQHPGVCVLMLCLCPLRSL